MRVLDWLRDRAIRRVLRLGVPVVLGKGISAISGLLTLAMLARHFDSHTFGVITMIRSVVTVIDQYANFNTWQAIVKYGTDAFARHRPEDVRAAIKLGFAVDLATGALGALVAAGLALAIRHAFEWTEHEAGMFVVYAVSLVFRMAGAPDGVFRLFDAYRTHAIATSVSSVIIVGTTAAAVVADAGFDGIVLAMLVSESIGNMFIAVVAMWVAHKHGFGAWWREPMRGVRARLPGIARFLLSTNAQLTVRKTQGELDMLVVGSMLGASASAMYRVVKQVGSIPGKLFMPFEQVLFTELARASAEGKIAVFRSLLWRSVGLLGLGSFTVWIFGAILAEPLISLIAGPSYADAAPAFRWYLLAMVVLIASAPVQRAMIALGRPGTLFWFELATLAVLAVAIPVGASYEALVGVSAGVLLHKLVQLALFVPLVRRVIDSRATPAQV